MAFYPVMIKDVISKRRDERLAGTIIGIYFFFYWLFTYLANLTGRIPIHTVRHFLYVHIFKVKIEKDGVIYSGCRFYEPGKLTMGHRSIVGYNAFLDARRTITIGENVNIGGDVAIFSCEHDINSPSFGGKGGPVVINDWVYIGTRAMILPGVTVGEGAVVASGAVVTKDVKPWTVVGGVPARYIKDRPVVKYALDTKKKAYFM